MSKLFKILISLMVICLSCTTLFACNNSQESTQESESEVQSIIESEVQSEEESEIESEEEETESNFFVELPEVDRM